MPQKNDGTPRGRFGTFGGVFTPSVLTILGVIMYLRLGWVLGSVGLPATLLIVTLASTITFLTGLSISAIATDQHVKIGGAYYMISRSLGIEPGGAIGVPLYFAQALSVALYTVGFAESVVRTFPALNEKAVAVVTALAVAAVALRSARTAIRVQYVIMAAIGLSLLSFFFGRAVEPFDPTLLEWRPGGQFWPVFAVFFPAVTGIMAGVNMSGDLKDPARALPRGTLLAIGTGYVMYMAIPVFLALRAGSASLVDDSLVMRRIALWDNAILLGVWGATLSSAVGSILGAPRVLQALSRDAVLPKRWRWLGRGSGPDDEPRLGTLLTLGVALVAILLGNLNLIAPILTMFFLTTYAVLNITAGTETLLGNPSYRPTFRVHWIWSFLGALGCLVVMFLINALAAGVAALAVIAIFLWLERRELTTTWGSVQGGLWAALARTGLMRMTTASDPKNWRPHLFVLSGAPTKRWHLIDLASALTHNRALLTVATVLGEEAADRDRVASMEETIAEYLERQGVRGLVRVTTATDPFIGALRLIETYGLGALVPNTIILGASERPEVCGTYCGMIEALHDARRNVLVVHHNPERGFGERRTIDVWWRGLRRNGGLMMVLAYLLSSSVSWRGADVRLKMVLPSDAALEGTRRNLVALAEDLRIGASPHLIPARGRTFDEILRSSSADADLVFLGMADPGEGFTEYYESLAERIAGLPSTVFVLASEDLAFRDVLLQTETRVT